MDTKDDQLQAYLTEKFGAFLSEERRQVIDHVLDNRTDHMRIVVEDLIDPHNINAIFRSGECLGVQNFHVIDNVQHFHIGKGVSKGASKWIDIHRHDAPDENNSLKAINALKDQGFRLFVTKPSAEATPLDQIDITTPFALVLGSERLGVSDTMVKHADQLVSIPMNGFTESFNVSVAGAILIHHFVNRIHKELDNWGLEKAEKQAYKYLWYKKCMARPDYYHKYYVKAYELDQNV